MKKPILFLALLWHASGFTASASWTAGAAPNTDWTQVANWAGPIPSTNNDTANLANAGTSPTSARAVTLDMSETINILNIDNGGAYNLSASGAFTLTFQTSDAAVLPTINITAANGQANHLVTCPISLTNNLTINQNSPGSAGLFTIGSTGITGAGSLTIAGTGIVALQGTNSFGGTTLNSGTLQVSSDGALGTGTTTLAGGTFQAGATFTSMRDINLTNAATIDTQSFTLSLLTTGVISGASTSASLTKIGGGKLELTGINTYAGGTFVNAGTLLINQENALGANGTTLTTSNATLQGEATFTIANHPISLTGSTTIDAQAHVLTISSVISNLGSLTTLSSGTGNQVVLSGSNTYSGGTVISQGTLSISNDGNLGNSSGGLTIGPTANATLLINDGSFSTARSISLTAIPSIIDTGAFTSTFSGSVSGTGSLTVQGGGIVVLSGSSTYTGGTNITASTTLVGNTNSLPSVGTINISGGTTLRIDQSFNGIFGGALASAGTLSINPSGNTGTITMTANNSGAFTGPVQVQNGSLIVNGSLASSSVSLAAGALLGGTGSIGSTTSVGGTIFPGNPTGTLTVQGTLSFDAASTAQIYITPSSSGAIAVSMTANLGNATVVIDPAPAFYPPNVCYTIVTSAGLGGTTFNDSPTSTNSNFVPSLSYTANNAILCVQVLNPFFSFPFSNQNTEAVGNNIGALNAAGTISPQLVSILNSFVGESNDAINAALDQMHPAPYSAYSEWQEEIGAQIISLFHRKPSLRCGSCCCDENRLWIKPFGDTLTEKGHGQEFGFTANSGGVALGYDREVTDDWVMGVGGVWNTAYLEWHGHHGHGTMNGFYGAFYTDYKIWNFYFGGSVMAGVDFIDTSRHIDFFTIDDHAKSNFQAIDVVAQLSSAYYFGTPNILLYPYANFDFLYLQMPDFKEYGATGLNLDVKAHTCSTFRTEMGFGFQVQDTNYDETLCISPAFSIGWVNMFPIDRPHFHSTFEGSSIPFTTFGWDQTWNLLALSFNLYIDYRCYKLGLEYNVEMSADKETLLYNHNGDIRFDWKF